MKKLLVMVLMVGLLISCRSISSTQVGAWLDGKQVSASAINLSGTWDCGEYMGGGWGTGELTQAGDRVSGTLGPYRVTGVVDGKKVFLVMEGGTRLYTARLTAQPDGRLVGKYVYNAFIDEKDLNAADLTGMTMVRVNQK